MATSNMNMYAPTSTGTRRERSIGELFSELASETGTLVRQEVELAKTELTQKATFIGKQSAIVGVGALLGVVALITFAGALVLILGLAMPYWASALIVTVLFGGAAALFASKGLTAIKNFNFKPTQTIASIEDNKQWATRQLQ